MERVKKSFPLKIISVILISVLTVITAISSIFALWGGYIKSEYPLNNKDKFMLDQAVGIMEATARYINSHIKYSNDDSIRDMLSENTVGLSENLMIQITDESGEIIYSDLDGKEHKATVTQKIIHREYDEALNYEEPVTEAEPDYYYDEYNNKIYYSGNEASEKYNESEYTVTLALKDELTQKDAIYYLSILYDNIVLNLTDNLLIAAASALITLCLFIYLMCAAGYKAGVEGIHISRFDRFPIDILTLIAGGAGLGAGVLIVSGFFGDIFQQYYGGVLKNSFIFDFSLLLIASIAAVIAAAAALVIYAMTAAVRLKTHTFIKSALIYKICRFTVKWCRKAAGVIAGLVRRLPMVWKTAAALVVIGTITLLLIGIDAPILLIPFAGLLGLLTLLTAIITKDIQNTTEAIAKGDTSKKINTKYMFGDMKKHAENINSINDGIALAVEQKMKSERFKTELITNVSHDIKTPLTSIINYVDLLEKEQIDNTTALEYIEVLSRQSARLKKLIEDLLEASKASTGNLSVKLARFEVGIILSQAMGEYEEKLKNNQLELIVSKPDTPIFINADSRHLWRVLDNVFNNIFKYALPGTRVYVDIISQPGSVTVQLRNISRRPLNISGDELMERFVRGDSSRNTEGSGLGLSIARSLTELQGGRFEVEIDGDLFKVRVTFPTA